MGLGDKKQTNLKEENRLKSTEANGAALRKAKFDHVCSEKDA